MNLCACGIFFVLRIYVLYSVSVLRICMYCKEYSKYIQSGYRKSLYTGHFYTIKGSTMELYGSTVLSNEVWIDLFKERGKFSEFFGKFVTMVNHVQKSWGGLWGYRAKSTKLGKFLKFGHVVRLLKFCQTLNIPHFW